MLTAEARKKLENRRRLKRYIKRCKIAFTVDNVTYRGLSSNFSLTGIFIRTSHQFPPGTLMDITLYFPNDTASQLKGRVVRVLNEAPQETHTTTKEYREKGMGIEIIKKDALYLHFIRSFLSHEGRAIFGQLLFSERDARYQQIKTELQERCHLFDVFVVLIGELPGQAGFTGKIWLEAKIKNHTDYIFSEPLVVFLTINDEQVHHEHRKSLPKIGTLLMSPSNVTVPWKPGETRLLEGEIDPLAENVLQHELKLYDYLIQTLGLKVEEPVCIDNDIATFWPGSPFLFNDSPMSQ